MWLNSNIVIFCLLLVILNTQITAGKRQRRYLIFTPATQYGIYVDYIRYSGWEQDFIWQDTKCISQVFATVSVPLHSESLVSVAWFFEANYYNVDNSTYFEPLLGDIGAPNIRHLRSTRQDQPILTRRSLYIFIENMLERHGYPGQCLLRAICENASQFLHNGVLGDLLHLILTPSTSMAEDDIEDSYYEAEYWGQEKNCGDYEHICPHNPIDSISVTLE